MRVECESCRELVVASLAIDGGIVRATCPLCQHVMSAPAGAPGAASQGPPHAPDHAPPGVPADAPDAAPLCPKCGAVRRDDAAACGSCGLTIERTAAYLEARDAAVPDPVREAWTRTAAAWRDEARHDELLRLVASHNAYAWAAGRYRTRGGDPMAQRQLERLRSAAEATLFASATVRSGAETRPYRGAAGVLAVLVVVIVMGLLYAIVIRDHPTPARPGARPFSPGPPGRAGTVRPLVPGHPVSPSTIK